MSNAPCAAARAWAAHQRVPAISTGVYGFPSSGAARIDREIHERTMAADTASERAHKPSQARNRLACRSGSSMTGSGTCGMAVPWKSEPPVTTRP
jgi:hypothetical protein